jgi:hypothetical protein
MRYAKYLVMFGLLVLCLGAAPYAHAQRIGVGIGIGPVGPAPVCAYGYYPNYPYACAPYGYYGPSWFSGGVFIGAGPWYHGFYGRPGYGWGRGGYGWGRGGYGYGRGYVGGGRGFAGHGAVGGGFHGNAARGGGGFHGGGHGGGHR